MSGAADFKTQFDAIVKLALGELQGDEALSLTFDAERSAFMRFNNCKVRQTGFVDQAYVGMKFFRGAKTYRLQVGLSGDQAADASTVADAISRARVASALLPDDPYQVRPTSADTSDASYAGKLLADDAIPQKVLGPAAGLDFTGIYSQGTICRGAANSAGARHWFSTDTFLVDYSAWLPNGRAVKSSYAGRDFVDADYAARLSATRMALENLHKPEVALKPGAYRAFVTADALNELITFFSWNGLGERGLRQGESAYLALKEGRESMSPLFSLTQDFTLGVEPAFNGEGELAADTLELIKGGKLANTLVSSRTAKQYGIASNAATAWEGVRSPAIGSGALPEADALKALGTGVYVSNFHYLNWSDTASARVTGMTRFSCLWVENGQVVGPIKDMRWDESLYAMLGSKLEAVTKERHLIVESATYEARQVGGCLLPGLLVNGLTFTL